MSEQATPSHFELVLARPVTLAAGEHPALVHLWWRGSLPGDRLVQVYVDDELYDVTHDPRQWEMWLLLDRSRAHRIELLAVPVDDAWVSQPERLSCWHPRVRDTARVSVLRDEALAIDTRLNVDVDSQPTDDAALWPSDAHRGGFGALFGEGGFGFDAITGPGLGAGELGHGPLGADGTAWRWRHGELAAGDHGLVFTARDRAGHPTAEPHTTQVTIDRLAGPAHNVRVDGEFVLNWR